MRIGLITIGDELLLGKTLNSNAFDLGAWLGGLGHELRFSLSIGDRREIIIDTLRDCMAGHGVLPRCEWLFLTGGLGPTPDDLTREAVAEYLKVSLEYNPEAAAFLAERLNVSIDQISEGQRSQLHVPRGAKPLRNPAGTACGFVFEAQGVRAFAFPGVPSEFQAMFDLHCRSGLERRDAVLLRRRAVTFGLPESKQREHLRDFVPPEPFRFSSLPAESGVVISLEAFVPLQESSVQTGKLDSVWSDLLSRLPPETVVDSAGASLSETVFRLLQKRQATVAVAESCTAGALGYLLTETPGSSEVFRQGYLTYANEAKTALLGVPADLLQMHGAVSEPVALAMAKGCLGASNADYSVAISGIAGPDGGSPEKPVGLVYIAVASRKKAEAKFFNFRGDRKSIRWRSAYSALNMLRLFILKDL